jgi:glycosyltransferase involved in cell wall biosynthesis
MDYPSVSIVIPTFNSAKTLRECLSSIAAQDYPKDKIEVIIADGGSTDGTQGIIQEASRSLNIRLLANALKTGEAGKALGLSHAGNEIVAFVDSDNILPAQDWLNLMLRPFSDAKIIASEPLCYTYRRRDNYITRYCALLGMNDPICLFLGNYDRYSSMTKRWTGIDVLEKQNDSYIEVGFLNGRIPTIGANGFFIRKNELAKYPIKDYFFDIDVLQFLYSLDPGIKVAKVKTGIIHIYSKTIRKFVSKQIRRFKDYTYYKAQGLRYYQWQNNQKAGIFKFILYTVFGITIIQAIRGWWGKRDPAWFFHPAACLVTLCVYVCLALRNAVLPLSPKKR